MDIGKVDRRRLYTGIWLVVALIISWLNIGSLRDQYRADRNLEHLIPSPGRR